MLIDVGGISSADKTEPAEGCVLDDLDSGEGRANIEVGGGIGLADIRVPGHDTGGRCLIRIEIQEIAGRSVIPNSAPMVARPSGQKKPLPGVVDQSKASESSFARFPRQRKIEGLPSSFESDPQCAHTA